MLISNNKLTNQQVAEVDLLGIDCKKTDGSMVAIYRHLLTKSRPLPCNRLYYHQNQLIGFLSAFFFEENACELSLMVAPPFRRQSIATQLIMDVLSLINQQLTIDTLIFSSPQGLNDHWLSAKGFRYRGSEYQMIRHSSQLVSAENHSLTIQLANLSDLLALSDIDNLCFPEHQKNRQERFFSLLNDSNYRLFIARQAGVPIGKAHLRWHQSGAYLSDIAIIPSLQKRGLGGALLAYCVNYAIAANKPTLFLDVDTQNKGALNLYTRLGFDTNNAFDYWSIPYHLITDQVTVSSVLK